MQTLVITSHPYPDQSRVIKALQETTISLQNVTMRNLESIYGHNLNGFNVAVEQKALLEAERIVFLFPIHWFNLTPMLKAYLNEVWTYGWAFGPDGTALQGKQMQVVVSTGASAYTLSPEGMVQSTIEEVLTPMKASALYVGMNYLPPIAFHEANRATAEDIQAFQIQLMETLAV